MTVTELKKELLTYATDLLTRRIEVLKNRRFVIAPYLRIKILKKRLEEISKLES